MFFGMSFHDRAADSRPPTLRTRNWTLVGVEKTCMTSDGIPHLLIAILTRAIRDLRHKDPQIRAAARQWLAEDPLCAEICEILGYTRPALHRAMGLASPQP
jgi:hypothetical protein